MKKITLIILILLFSISFFSFTPQKVQAQACNPGVECCPQIICPEGFRGGLVPCARDCNVPPVSGIDLIDETCPCQLCHLFVMADKILDFIFFIIIPLVAVLMLVIGGLVFFFAGTSPQRLSQAKSIITSTIFGLIIIFAAWLIINTFFVIIGVAGWTGLQQGWFSIVCPIP